MLTDWKNMPKIREIGIFGGPKTWIKMQHDPIFWSLLQFSNWMNYKNLEHVENQPVNFFAISSWINIAEFSWIQDFREITSLWSDTTHSGEKKNRLSRIILPFLHGFPSDRYQKTRNKISFPMTPQPHRCVLWEPRYLKLKTNRPTGGSDQKSTSGFRNCSVIP